MNKDRILQTLKKDVRSLLIASKLGLGIQELEHDYRMMIGAPLPLRTLDYRSTMELLLDMPDVVHIRTNVDGTVVLSAVVNEETRSMAELVSRQKTTCKRKGIYKRRTVRPVSHMDLVRRGRVAPVLPASVKSELRDLLSISSLLVSQLETAYYKRFGRSFQYTRYGFYSLLEVLRSVSDFVQVQQTKAGSLLMLKAPARNATLQFLNPGNVFKGTSNVSVQREQNPPKKPIVVDSPPTPAPPQSAGVITLDKLFMAAEVQYYATKQSAQSLTEGEGDTEIVSSFVRAEHSDFVNVSTSSSLTPATVQDIVPLTHIENGTEESPNLNTGSVKTCVEEHTKDCNLGDLEEKFDKDLKLCLSQTRAGFVIGNDLRQDIRHVVCKYAEGLPVSHLLSVFKQHTGKDLPFKELGFMSVLDLVGSLGDLLYLEDSKDGQDWRLFDIESRKKNVNDESESAAADDSITRWNIPTQKSERLQPPVIISPADGKILWSSMVVPLAVSQSEIPPDAVRKKKLCSISRMKRGFMVGVYVENVTSPSDFYIRCCGTETSQKLEDMMIEMRFCYSNEHVSSRYVVPDEYVIVGEIYALSVDGDVWWYRVIVHALISSEDIQVFFPDFGTLATVKRCWLRFLKACYMTLPAQAVHSTLAFLKPVQNQWSVEGIKMFQNHCARGPLVGVVLQYVSDQLCLFLCDTTTDEDVYLHQVLIDTGHASLAQEPRFFKAHNPLMRYLIQSSEKPQEKSQDESRLSESTKREPVEVQVQESVSQTRETEDIEPELPYLEAFPIGEDLWDEQWSFSGSMVSLNDALKSAKTISTHHEEKPKLETKNVCNEDQLSKQMEEFYISLIETRDCLEKSAILHSAPGRYDKPEKTVQPATDLHADHILQFTTEEEKTQSLEDNCLFHESSSLNPTERGSNPLLGFHKFQIPRSSATIALGPAARLAATPGSLLNWVTEPGKV
ncbi:tudor domain-containing protein 5 isoform X3 [Engystomops pustulosus]|uniref:tudor domain-containing protein 5 isoform X3 n=1 Tax=Engystomops pustulosus TaxID=76066 RepID=UPI003AFB06D7